MNGLTNPHPLLELKGTWMPVGWGGGYWWGPGHEAARFSRDKNCPSSWAPETHRESRASLFCSYLYQLLCYSKWSPIGKLVTSYLLPYLSTRSKTQPQDYWSLLSASPFIGTAELMGCLIKLTLGWIS